VNLVEERTIKILVVEDNPADARLVQEGLKETPGGGFEMAVAERLSEGVRLVHEGFDLVLLDLRLSDSEGFATFETMHTEAPDVPIVVLSGMADESLAVRAVQEGAQDYLVKGKAEAEALARAIRYAVARHATQVKLLGRLQSGVRGRVIGFLGAKGGVGTTTTVLNIASTAAAHGKHAIAAELRPCFGTFAASLGKGPPRSVADLAKLGPDQIGAADLNPWLGHFEHGLRVLFGSQSADEFVELSPQQFEAIVEKLAEMADFVFADLGSCLSPAIGAALTHCDLAVIVLQPEQTSLEMAKTLAEVIQSHGIAGERLLALIVNHVGLTQSMGPSDIRAELDCGIIGVIPPVEEDLRLMAVKHGTPLVLAFPENIASTAYTEIFARLTAERVAPLVF
jgi:MinD-like ATPase involved in chromosome partitioning or flagellar assembly/CheY-like chemotaxis protein